MAVIQAVEVVVTVHRWSTREVSNANDASSQTSDSVLSPAVSNTQSGYIRNKTVLRERKPPPTPKFQPKVIRDPNPDCRINPNPDCRVSSA